MKVLISSVLGLALLAVCVRSATTEAQEKKVIGAPTSNAKFMRAKLGHTQSILESLATEDFGQIEKSAQALSLLSYESTWNVFETEQYLQHSKEFRRRVEALSRSGKEKNLDGASLAFVELTLNCVNCHKHVRDVQAGKLDTPKAEREKK
jgi:hypothetical protein